TAEEADLFLPIAPGADTTLFCGLLVDLIRRGAVDQNYVSEHTVGFAEAYARAHEIAPDLATTARATGLTQGSVQYFFDLFYASARVITCYSQGVNQSAQGIDKLHDITTFPLAIGRMGISSMWQFSLSGQPNATAGPEVGGLAN